MTCIMCLIVPVTAVTLVRGVILLNLASAGLPPGILVSALFDSSLWVACRVEQRLFSSVDASWHCFCLFSFHPSSVFMWQDFVLCF